MDIDTQAFLKALYSYRATSVQWSKMFLNNSFIKPDLPEFPGVYMYLSPIRPNGKHDVIYAGQANNLKRRFGEHLNDLDRRIVNAMYFIFSYEPDSKQRDNTENALIKYYNPLCNDKLKRTI